MKKYLLIVSLILLFAVEMARVYFIMPFPGSQQSDNLPIAYWLHNNIFWIRILLLIVVFFAVGSVFSKSAKRGKIVIWSVLGLYALVYLLFNFHFQADKMFYEPVNKAFASADHNVVKPEKLVLGVIINGEARAYPLQYIGYHHQVMDTIKNVPVMITYCTVCRTGRVYSPKVNGKAEYFRLVGMDHFNAMFEDQTTKSWWQQATGVAVAGKLKGKALAEIPSVQASLGAWLEKNPASLILQPDTLFHDQYKGLADFDKGTIDSHLEKRDSVSWKLKSWVIGVDRDGHSKAYDWNLLAKTWMIQDSLPAFPLLITLEKDTASFHVFNRLTKSGTLSFMQLPDGRLTDSNSGSLWNDRGLCIEGTLKGEQLSQVQAYQEFYHSWKNFHPNTAIFKE